MTGPNCLKLLDSFSKIAKIMDDKDLQEKFEFLFDSLHVLAGYLLTTTPLRLRSESRRMGVPEWPLVKPDSTEE